jgi:hypothetical protein
MIDLTREFTICLLVAWSCFVAGVWAIRYSHCADLIYLGRYLIALCPIVLSLFSSHSVSVCEQVILSKKSEAVNARVYLTSITRTDLGGGVRIEREQYSSGGRSVCIKMPIGAGATTGAYDGAESNAPPPSGIGRSAIRLRGWGADSGDTFASFADDGGAGLGEPF